jgi:hypothetical protein
LNDSFAFEVAPCGSCGFYRTVVNGYALLFKDGISAETVKRAKQPNEGNAIRSTNFGETKCRLDNVSLS